MMVIIYLFIILLSFIAMEGVAWITHKYLMHGILWFLHNDHHRKNPQSFFEKNDYFFLIFAIPGIVALAIGSFMPELRFLLFMGIGITLYGFSYFTIHDVFIHQRFKWLRRTDNFYFRAIRKAHKVHHKHLDKENGECFGMLWVPPKYFIEALKSKG